MREAIERKDRMLRCIDCLEEFTWSASEQVFYASKGYTQPRRCPFCRAYMRRKHKELAQRTIGEEVRHEQ